MSKPNILLVTIDALRADRFNSRTMWSLWDRLEREQGKLYTQVISACSFTTPSVCSILTGVYPTVHGVRHLKGEKLPKSIPTISEVLQAEEYYTAAVAGILPLQLCGLESRFDHFEGMPNPFATRQHGYYTKDLYKRAQNALEGVEEPWFLWVHNADAHEPWVTTYDDAISYIDFETNALIDELSPDYSIVTSDHGEALTGDREAYYREGGKHGDTLYEEEIKVPLAIYPRPEEFDEKTVEGDSLLSTVDIFPLIADLAGVKGLRGLQAFDHLLHGNLANWHGTRSFAYSETTHPRTHFDERPLRAVRFEDQKFIETWDMEDQGWFDLEKDPKELRKNIKISKDMHTEVREFFSAIEYGAQEAESVDLSKEEEERITKHLQNLGYVD